MRRLPKCIKVCDRLWKHIEGTKICARFKTSAVKVDDVPGVPDVPGHEKLGAFCLDPMLLSRSCTWKHVLLPGLEAAVCYSKIGLSHISFQV